MRNNQHVAKEIVQLCAIKASYKYFLASERSMFEVENTTQVQQNLCVINRSLKDLYEEFEYTKGHEGSSRKSVGKKFHQTTTSNHQLNAIMLFNADSRFTLRE